MVNLRPRYAVWHIYGSSLSVDAECDSLQMVDHIVDILCEKYPTSHFFCEDREIGTARRIQPCHS